MQVNTINYRPEIDGLRALAVIAVLLFHLDFSFIPGGFVGVDVFFVISGFLITRILQREISENRFSFSDFYARRIRRIFPVLFVVFAVSFLLAILFLVPGEYKTFIKDLRYAAFQMANIHFANGLDYFNQEQATSPLLHTWSLGVEEQFYLIYPLILVAIHKILGLKKAVWVLLPFFFVSLGVSQYLLSVNENHAFYLLHSRAWELALGGLLALNFVPSTCRKNLLSGLVIVGTGLMIVPMFIYSESGFPGVKALLPCLGAGLIIYASLNHESRLLKIYSWKPLVFIGLISYSLYLWHWVFIAFYKAYYLNADQSLTLLAQSILLVLSVAIACISYKIIEQPFRKGSASSFKVIMFGFFVIVMTYAISDTVRKFDQSWRFLADFDIRTLDADPLERNCEAQILKDGACVDDLSRPVDVIIAGDSHAIHYASALKPWAISHNYNVQYIIRSACPVWFTEPHDLLGKSKKSVLACVDRQTVFSNAIKQSDVKYIFLAIRGDSVTQLDPRTGKLEVDSPTVESAQRKFKERVATALKVLEESKGPNAQVVVLGQVPLYSRNPAACTLKEHLYGALFYKPSGCEGVVKPSGLNGYSNTVMHNMSKVYNYTYFDPAVYLLGAVESFYRDTNHLNTYGSSHLSLGLKKFLNSFM